MYNTQYIFTECGFDWVPNYIDREKLFNVSYDLHTAEIKLYVLGGNGKFLYKISQKGIYKQYDALTYGADPERLGRFLGGVFDYQQIVLDTFEDDTYYVYVDDASESQFISFFNSVCRKFGVNETDFLTVVNRINQQPSHSIHDCYVRKTVSGVKIPFLTNQCKLYAKPFQFGNGYDLNAKALEFLTRLYACERAGLEEKIQHLWVSAEIFSSRVVVTTQHHQLVHSL